jgi:hypothetical protein
LGFARSFALYLLVCQHLHDADKSHHDYILLTHALIDEFRLC